MSTETKNYITPVGWQALKDELYQLVNKERPEIVQIVNWAASNGDRSENGDYLYGKRRMREIDRRIRFLTKRLEAVVKALNPQIESFDSSCFNGIYQTGDIDQAYLDRLSAEKSGCGGLKVHPSRMEHSISISDAGDEE